MPNCPRCGAENEEAAAVCQACSAPLAEEEAAVPPPAEPAVPETPAAPPPVPPPSVEGAPPEHPPGIPPPPEEKPLHLRPRGQFLIRAAARLLDWVILSVALTPLFCFAVLPMMGELMREVMLDPEMASPEDLFGAEMVLTFLYYGLAATALVVAYNTFMVARYGATLGKMVCRLRVVPADGSAMTFRRAFWRSLAIDGVPWGLAAIPGALACVGYLLFLIAVLFVAFDEQRQGLHDRLVGTYVVQI